MRFESCSARDFRPGVVVALPAEARALLGRRRWTREGAFAVTSAPGPWDAETLWVRSGVGMARAEAAAAWLLSRGVTHLGIIGVSGGLAPGLESGCLVLGDAVAEEGGARWATDAKLVSALASCCGGDPRIGALLTTRQPVLSVAEKARWHAASQAMAVDMESASVARAAAQAGKPFFAMRAICDGASRPVPQELFALVDDLGRPRPGRLASTLLRRPSLVGDLLRMQKDFGRALAALKEAYRGLLRITLD